MQTVKEQLLSYPNAALQDTFSLAVEFTKKDCYSPWGKDFELTLYFSVKKNKKNNKMSQSINMHCFHSGISYNNNVSWLPQN